MICLCLLGFFKNYYYYLGLINLALSVLCVCYIHVKSETEYAIILHGTSFFYYYCLITVT